VIRAVLLLLIFASPTLVQAPVLGSGPTAGWMCTLTG